MRVSSLVASIMTLAMMAAVAVPSAGCPGDEKECSDYSPPASFDATTPVISFKNDVFPIFGFSCAFSSCHGSSAGAANGIFLGGQNPSTVRTNLVGVAAPELPTMPFVTAGDPRNSYLMRKLDGSNCVLNAQCTDGSCGDPMPQNSDRLPIEQRDKIRRWIAQGAPDN